MVWRYLKNNTKPVNYHYENDMLWHIKDSIDAVEIRLMFQAVQQLKPAFDLALKYKKPLRFFLNGNIRGVMGKIILPNLNQLSIETFSENISTQNYNPNKINKITTNGFHIYYNWDDIPTALKQFIINNQKPEPEYHRTSSEEINKIMKKNDAENHIRLNRF